MNCEDRGAGARGEKAETEAGSSSSSLVLSPALGAEQYETVLTDEQLKAWIERIKRAELVSVDTETTSLDPMTAQLVGISLSVQGHQGAYIPVGHTYAGAPAQLSRDHVLAALKDWLENPRYRKLGQNLKYDKHVFANCGILLGGVEHDTLLQSYVLESHRPHDMDDLAARHLGITTITYDDVTGKGASRIAFEQVELSRATEYAAEDADVTLQLHQVLYPQVEQDSKLLHIYRNIEMPVMEVLFTMERNGVLLDTRLLDQQSQELGIKMLGLEQAVHLQAGQPFNLNSPKQLQEILFVRHKLPVKKKTPGGLPSTDEDVLQELALDHPLPKLILEYRSLSKAEIHLHRQAAAHGERQDGTGAYELRAGGGGNRPALEQRSEPAEHSGSHRGRPPHTRGFHCTARLGHCFGGLFPDRAAHHGASVPGQRTAAGIRRRRGRAPAHRIGNLRRRIGGRYQRTAPLRESHQLRTDLRHVGVRAGLRSSASSALPRSNTWNAISCVTRA